MPSYGSQMGRAPASRRAAIRISAGVSTLTTTAWARVALNDHRDGDTVVRKVTSLNLNEQGYFVSLRQDVREVLVVVVLRK